MTQKKIADVPMTQILKEAGKPQKKTGNGVRIRIFEAAEEQIPRYKRRNLKAVLPKAYWDRISWVKEPDSEGDPLLEFHAAHTIYSTVTFVIDALGDDHPFLREAETTERALMTLFRQGIPVK